MRRLALAMLALAAVIPGQESLSLEEVLRRPVLLDPNQPALEVKAYTAARVPAVPAWKTAAEWDAYAGSLRREFLEKVVLRGEARAWVNAPAKVEWLDVLPGRGYRVKKFRFEVMPGMWLPGLLYEPEKLRGKAPAVLNVNGHERTGMATPYIQTRCIHLARNGIVAMNPEWFNRGQLQNASGFAHSRLNQLDLTGTSGVSLFYLSMQRTLDLLISLPNTDPERIAVTGLSGGGWQTIFLSALDTRVKLANPVAGYSSFVTRTQFPDLDLGDSEQTPSDMAAVADYAHLTALMAPRVLQLAYNAKDDCCFRADYAVGPLLQAGRLSYSAYKSDDRLRYHINHGKGHNYDGDNRDAFYSLLQQYFLRGRGGDLPPEQVEESEIRPAEQLAVPLPEGNLDFQTLALRLAGALPRQGVPAGREELKEIVRLKEYAVDAVAAGSARWKAGTARFWRLRMGQEWTVPAVEVEPAMPNGTVLVVADEGRAEAAQEIEPLLTEGRRVVAIDPFYFGESKFARRAWLWAILVAAVGDRPLGLQAGQVAAAARWLAGRGLGPVTLHASGFRSSLFALIAAAAEPQAISEVRLRGAMTSLKGILERDLTAEQAPELFCFGLLESFDIPQIGALVSPRAVRRIP